MTFLDARILFDHWLEVPPENEMLARLAQAYTTWRPQRADRRKLTEEEIQEENFRSVQERWRTGQSMSPKQMIEAFGGAGAVNVGKDGVFRSATGQAIPGVKPFPGVA